MRGADSTGGELDQTDMGINTAGEGLDQGQLSGTFRSGYEDYNKANLEKNVVSGPVAGWE